MTLSKKDKALAAIDGLTLSDVLGYFGRRARKRDKKIAAMVETDDLDFECDLPLISEGDDNGAYVMGWRWVDFGGTDLDKGTED